MDNMLDATIDKKYQLLAESHRKRGQVQTILDEIGPKLGGSFPIYNCSDIMVYTMMQVASHYYFCERITNKISA